MEYGSLMNIPRRWLAAAVAGLAGLTTIGLGVALSSSPAAAAACQVAAAGDIAASGGAQQNTGNQIRALAPQYVLPLGDIAYDNGSTSDFANYYNGAWGSFKSITRPTPGNHEYQTSGAAGYFAYFSGQVGTSAYYAFDVCGWRLYSLNSELTGTARSTMLSWFAADAASHSTQPGIAYWHKPRWSDGLDHGNDTGQNDLWVAAANAKMKLVLNGHDHIYERYAEMNASGVATSGGTREFIVGTGGAPLYAADGSYPSTSQKVIVNSHGVLLLTLRTGGYDYKFADWDGSTSDAGSLNFPIVTPTPTTSTSVTPSVTPTTSSPSPTDSPTPCVPTTVTSTATVTAPPVTSTVTVTGPATTVTVTAPPSPFTATLTGVVTPPA